MAFGFLWRPRATSLVSLTRTTVYSFVFLFTTMIRGGLSASAVADLLFVALWRALFLAFELYGLRSPSTCD